MRGEWGERSPKECPAHSLHTNSITKRHALGLASICAPVHEDEFKSPSGVYAVEELVDGHAVIRGSWHHDGGDR